MAAPEGKKNANEQNLNACIWESLQDTLSCVLLYNFRHTGHHTPFGLYKIKRSGTWGPSGGGPILQHCIPDCAPNGESHKPKIPGKLS